MKYIRVTAVSARLLIDKIWGGGFAHSQRLPAVLIAAAGDRVFQQPGVSDFFIDRGPVLGRSLDFHVAKAEDPSQERLVIGEVVDLFQRAFLGKKVENALLVDYPQVGHRPDIPAPKPFPVDEVEKGDGQEDAADPADDSHKAARSPDDKEQNDTNNSGEK